MKAEKEIHELLDTYFSTLHSGDAERLQSIFHPLSKLYNNVDGLNKETNLTDYINIVKNRSSPETLGHDKVDRIINIYVSSPLAAVATVRLTLFGRDFTDQLSLIREGDKWLIMTKIYYLNATA
jgi:hypothetical protein